MNKGIYVWTSNHNPLAVFLLKAQLHLGWIHKSNLHFGLGVWQLNARCCGATGFGEAKKVWNKIQRWRFVVVGLAVDVFFHGNLRRSRDPMPRATRNKALGLLTIGFPMIFCFWGGGCLKKKKAETIDSISFGLLATLHVEKGWVGPYDLDPASLKKQATRIVPWLGFLSNTGMCLGKKNGWLIGCDWMKMKEAEHHPFKKEIHTWIIQTYQMLTFLYILFWWNGTIFYRLGRSGYSKPSVLWVPC